MADTVIHSITGGVIEKYLPGDRYTAVVHAAGATHGGKLVALQAGHDRQVDECGADSTVCGGVALYDAAPGEPVTIATEGVWLLKASGAITAGARVKTGAAGVVVALAADVDPRLIVGYALADIADTETGPIKLTL